MPPRPALFLTCPTMEVPHCGQVGPACSEWLPLAAPRSCAAAATAAGTCIREGHVHGSFFVQHHSSAACYQPAGPVATKRVFAIGRAFGWPWPHAPPPCSLARLQH